MSLRISVKQLNLFGCKERPPIGGCPRAWGFSYLDQLKPDWLAPQLVDGIKFHHCVGSLVVFGRMPEPGVLQPGVELTPKDVEPEGHFGRMARAALIYIPVREYPAPGQHGTWVSEHVGSFQWTTTNGVECTIDLRPDLASAPIADPTMNYLVDFKSTSNKRYALRSLLNDVQANTYSAGLITLGAASVLARWIYVDKNTYASWPVEAVFHPERTLAWVHENVDATIELIHTICNQGGLRALDLPADIEACGGVGRFCDHAERCLTGPVGPPASRLITLEEVTRFIGRTEE